MSDTTAPAIIHISPFFIVRNVLASVEFYRQRLGFELMFLGPDDDPYFAIVKRDEAPPDAQGHHT